jgi:hypothetical protein
VQAFRIEPAALIAQKSRIELTASTAVTLITAA